MDGDDDEETGYSSGSNEYNDTGYNPGNEGSDSDCNRVCEYCTRPNPNCCEFLICCCRYCFRTGGVECDAECDEEWLLARYDKLPKHKSLMLLKIGIPGPICRFRLCQKIRFWLSSAVPQKFAFEARHIMRLMNVGLQELGEDLEIVQRPDIVWKREANPHKKEIYFRSWRLTFWERSWMRRKFQQKLALKLLKVVFRIWRLMGWELVD